MTSVYVIEAQGGPVKIGIAKDPRARLRDLGTGTPFPLRLAHVEDPGELGAAQVEKAAHALLAAARTHGEWFAVTVDEARSAVQAAILQLRSSSFHSKGGMRCFRSDGIRADQCRSARNLVSWRQTQLAEASGISVFTIRKLECEQDIPKRSSLDAIQLALENAGVMFIPRDDEFGPGVRLRKVAQISGEAN